MKIIKYILPILTAAFLCVLLGMFIGRNSSHNFLKLTENSQTVSNEGLHSDSDTSKASSEGKVNINTAGIPELCLLPGIGEVLAQRIMDYRTKKGNFKSINDLTNVEGIGAKKLEQILPYVTIGG